MNQSYNSNSQERYFLLNTDCMATKLDLKSRTVQVERQRGIRQGTILKEYVTSRQDRTLNLHKQRQIVATVLNEDNNHYAVDLNNVSNISEEDMLLLLSVQPISKRTVLYNSKDVMKEAKSITKGDTVTVDFDDGNYIQGIVLKKDKFSEEGPGVMFAVRLLTERENSMEACDIIAPFNKIRLSKSDGKVNESIKISAKLLSSNQGSSKGLPKFNLNDRVVWLSETGPEYGYVRWMGHLPEQSGVYIGVEFDKPVGTGNGTYNNKALFSANRKHGGFIPIEDLRKEKDWVQKDPPQKSSSGSFFSKMGKKKKDSDAKKNNASNSAIFYDTDKNHYQQQPQFHAKTPDRPMTPKEVPVPERESLPADYSMQKAELPLMKSGRLPSEPIYSAAKNSTPSLTTTKNQKPLPPITQQPQKTPPSSPYSAKIQVKRFPVESSSTLPSSQSLLPNKLEMEQPKPVTIPVVSSKSWSTKGSPSPTTSRKRSTSAASELAEDRISRKSLDRTFANESAMDKENFIVDGHLTKINVNGRGKDEKRNEFHNEQMINKRASSNDNLETSANHKYDINKEKQEIKIESWSDKVRNGKSKSSGDAPYNMETAINSTFDGCYTAYLKSPDSQYDNHRQNSSSGSYRSPMKTPESPIENDYYQVAKDECHPDDEVMMSDQELEISDMERFLSLTLDEKAAKSYKTGTELDDSADLGVGSVVEVTILQQPWYGVIRWVGPIEFNGVTKLVAGVEMEEEHEAFCNGKLEGRQCFECPKNKGFFIFLSLCRKDSRFLDSLQINLKEGKATPAFGSIDCPAVRGEVAPLSYSDYVYENLFGKNKGIQGHHNSCYLDATLFSMFMFTPVFDNLLHRPPLPTDIYDYKEVQRVLKEEIVNPLRQNMYVRADRVMRLRTLLEKLSSVSGLTCEEKDPEEFLNSLLHQILKAEPYLKLSSGQESYFYQLFVEKNDRLKVPTVQQLFEQSFLTSDIKLKEIPSCLIIQMPRHGKQFKMYNRIFPSPILDITEILEDSPRQCFVCGSSAQFECRECFYSHRPEFIMKSYCHDCSRTVHHHLDRTTHKPRKIAKWDQFNELTAIPHVQMELFAVVCIETSHYVAFVKCGNADDVPWCFFDSMADRKGEQNGYNIPEIVLCPELSDCLTEDGLNELEDNPDKPLPERLKRLFGDAYLCMYQNASVMMYH